MMRKLAELTMLDGISGNEQEIRKFIIQNLQISPLSITQTVSVILL